MIYVLDTHPIVWFVEKSPLLTSAAKAVMNDPTAELVIPTIALIEVRYLYAKGRIATAFNDVQRDIISATNCTIYPIDEHIVSLVPTVLDIHDGIIVATALVYRDLFKLPTALITKDSAIKNSGLIQTIW